MSEDYKSNGLELSDISERIQQRATMDFSKEPVVVSFKNVSKTYKLYKNDKQRFLGLTSIFLLSFFER